MKDYLKAKRLQQGGAIQPMSVDAWRDNISIPKTDAIPTKQPIQVSPVMKNLLTGQAVTGATKNDPGAPLLTPAQMAAQSYQGTIATPRSYSLREKALGLLNKVDRTGDNQVANIVTQPLKAALRTLRPDAYFKGANSDADIMSGVGKLGLDAAMIVPATAEVRGVGNILKEGSVLADSQFSRVGRQLEDVAMRGRYMDLTDHQIAANQLDKVGITSNQRRAYVPGVSDVLQKGVHPFGYPDSFGDLFTRMREGNDLNTMEKEVANGGLSSLHTQGNLRRNDAWRMYLGIPQKNNTFRMAEESEPGWPTKANEDRYSLNVDGDNSFVRQMSDQRPTKWSYEVGSDPSQPQLLGPGSKTTASDAHGSVMGNYGIKVHPQGLEYWDRWDLDPEIRTGFNKVIPYEDGINQQQVPQRIKVPISSFIGKPFISNGMVSNGAIKTAQKARVDELLGRQSTYMGTKNSVINFMNANPPAGYNSLPSGGKSVIGVPAIVSNPPSSGNYFKPAPPTPPEDYGDLLQK